MEEQQTSIESSSNSNNFNDFLTNGQVAFATNNERIHGVIYEWRLDQIDHSHHLYDITYVGQVCKSLMTADKAFEIRTRKHITDSKNNPKETGLHAAISMFGVDAFSVNVLFTKHASKTETMEWANRLEIKLISERGGILQDMDKRLCQTLNLTKGGQGDARVVWQSIQARSAAKWHKWKGLLEQFYEREKHLNVGKLHIENGKRLGFIVAHMRRGTHSVHRHQDRLNWLMQRGWKTSIPESRWDSVQQQLLKYFEDHGDLDIPTRHEYLGHIVSGMRSKGTYIKNNPERLQWLLEHGWVKNKFDGRWKDVKLLIESHYQEFGHLDIKQNCIYRGEHLGQIVSDIRNKHAFLKKHPERLEWLQTMGWIDNKAEKRWKDLVLEFEIFYAKNGHINVSSKDIEFKKLFKVVSHMRHSFQHIKGNKERIQWVYNKGLLLDSKNSLKNKAKWKLLYGTLD